MALIAPRLWLIVAGAQDRAAQTLTREFRVAGQRAVLVATPEMARAYAAKDVVCVVVFSSDGPDPATLATVLGLRCAGHLPVTTPDFGDPPAGPWATEALSASVLNDALTNQLRERWERIALADATQAVERTLPEPPAAPLTKSQRKDRNLNRARVGVLIFSAMIALIAFVNVLIINKQIDAYHYQPTPTYPLGQAYRVHVPGKCATNPSVNWYSTDGDKETCRSDGLLMERDNLAYSDRERFSPLEYDPNTYHYNPSRYFGTAYTVQATMRFIKSDASSCMGLNVFEQTDNNLGGVQVEICANRHWNIIFFAANGSEDGVLRSGVLPKALPISNVMRVRVQGSQVAVQFNGVSLASVVVGNYGYSATYSVSLVDTTIGGDSKVVTQVLFSDFSVQPDATPAKSKQIAAQPREGLKPPCSKVQTPTG